MLDSDPRLGIFTTVSVVRQRKPIVRVYHDLEGDWQFFAQGETNESEYAMLVAAEEILTLHPTIREIASMPPGHVATREEYGSEWTVSIMKPKEATMSSQCANGNSPV